MTFVSNEALISGLLDFLFVMIFCIIGAIVKDTYDTLTGKYIKIQVNRILISAIVSSIILFSLSDIILRSITWRLFILPCFVGGMVGFEAMGKLSKMIFWIKLASKKKDIINQLIEEEEKKERQEEDKNKNNNLAIQQHNRDG